MEQIGQLLGTLDVKTQLHRSLVRQVIRMRMQDRQKALNWLRGYTNELRVWVKGWNELHPESTLEKDVLEQWHKGNRGKDGEWYE